MATHAEQIRSERNRRARLRRLAEKQGHFLMKSRRRSPNTYFISGGPKRDLTVDEVEVWLTSPDSVRAEWNKRAAPGVPRGCSQPVVIRPSGRIGMVVGTPQARPPSRLGLPSTAPPPKLDPTSAPDPLWGLCRLWPSVAPRPPRRTSPAAVPVALTGVVGR